MCCPCPFFRVPLLESWLGFGRRGFLVRLSLLLLLGLVVIVCLVRWSMLWCVCVVCYGWVMEVLDCWDSV